MHILLDAEGQGLWKVQGNNFVNTVGYFIQYIEQLPKNAEGHPEIPGLSSETLNKLLVALINLATHENEQISTSADNVDILIDKTMQELLELKADIDYMLPGGWKNENGGHAMIYQFRKISATENAPEKLRFSIYNSGAGLDEHEKQSTTTHEAYFPVQTYEIPMGNLIKKQFKTFIHRLIVPRFTNYYDKAAKRRREPYDETKLYQDINNSIPYLNTISNSLNSENEVAKPAELIPASTAFSEHFNTIITPGQISGTCSQQSIYEMLKVNLNALSIYKRLSLKNRFFSLS